jgi:NitT/TauT family transport system ATP-binding protein
MSDAPALLMHGVEKRFELGRQQSVTAIARVDLQIDAGEFVAIVGPSGCGKSTLLRLGAGLLEPSGGRIERRDADASFVFQEPALLPWRSVAGNVQLPLELTDVPREQRAARIERVLGLVGLADWADALPRQLSGGMRMRVALARALVVDAPVVYFDEPFAAIDELTREELNSHLLDVWRQRRFAALFVTHNIHEAVFLADRVVVMSPRPGRLLGQVEVPFELPRRPELRTSAAFIDVVRGVSELLRAGSGAPAELASA